EEPRRDLHQPGGEPHAFGRIGERGAALKLLGLGATRTVKIGRRLLDQGHPVAKQIGESLRIRKPLAKGDGARLIGRLFGHHKRPDATPTIFFLAPNSASAPTIAPRLACCPGCRGRRFRHSCRRATLCPAHRVSDALSANCAIVRSRPPLAAATRIAWVSGTWLTALGETRNSVAPCAKKGAAVAGGS